MRRSIATGLIAAMIATALALPAAAEEEAPSLGAQILADADGQFDRKFWDYDIIGEVVKAILDSGIDTGLVASVDESADLTVFLPNDLAFKRLARDLTGKWIWNEADVIPAILGAVEDAFGTETLEETLGVVNTIVEYHVVNPADQADPAVQALGSITSDEALAADGVSLTSLEGTSFTVDVRNAKRAWVQLIDVADLRNPWLVRWQLDNFASNGVWHGISRVLIPVEL